MITTKRAPVRFFKFIAWALLVFSVVGLVRVVLDIRLAALGVIADGTVTHIEIKSSSSSTVRHSGESRSQYELRRDRQKRGSTRYATVRFQPADGSGARNFKTVCTFGDEIKTGDAVQVIHLPSDPGVAEIYSAKQLWWPIGVGITVTLAAAGIGLWLLRLARRGQDQQPSPLAA